MGQEAGGERAEKGVTEPGEGATYTAERPAHVRSEMCPLGLAGTGSETDCLEQRGQKPDGERGR